MIHEQTRDSLKLSHFPGVFAPLVTRVCGFYVEILFKHCPKLEQSLCIPAKQRCDLVYCGYR